MSPTTTAPTTTPTTTPMTLGLMSPVGRVVNP
jgi:hypothetical protein